MPKFLLVTYKRWKRQKLLSSSKHLLRQAGGTWSRVGVGTDAEQLADWRGDISKWPLQKEETSLGFIDTLNSVTQGK